MCVFEGFLSACLGKSGEHMHTDTSKNNQMHAQTADVIVRVGCHFIQGLPDAVSAVADKLLSKKSISMEIFFPSSNTCPSISPRVHAAETAAFRERPFQ